jgi:hypothetical protein
MNHTATPVSVGCDHCGESQLVPSTTISVMVHKKDATFTYAFTCTWCNEVVCKPLYYNCYQLLRGITPVYYFDVVPEMLEEHSGPPINHDDVLAFHEMPGGGGDDRLDRLVGRAHLHGVYRWPR